MTTHFLGIDVPKRERREWLRKLRPKKGILDVSDRGAYTECPDTVCLWVDTTLDLEALEAWVDASHLEVLGCFHRKNYLKADGYLFDRLEARPISECE